MTIMELVVVLAIVGAAIFYFAPLLTKSGQSSQTLSERQDVETTMLEAQKFIRRLGRVAQACAKVGSSELHCQVDFTVPPKKTYTWVRFFQSGSELLYDFCKGPYDSAAHACSGAGWVTQTKYRNLSVDPALPAGFIVCNSNDLNTGGCSSLSSAAGLGKIRAVGMTAPVDNRFFLYQLTGATYASPTSPNASYSLSFRSGFYTRNPVGTWGKGMVYQWGG